MKGNAAEPDYYAVLGVAEDATAQEIKNARNRLARRHHADVAGSSSADHDAMIKVNEAYGVVGVPDKRRDYDKRRAATRFAGAFKWPPPTTPTSGAKKTSPKPRKKPAAKKAASPPSPTEQARQRMDQVRADFEKRMAELRQRANKPVKKPNGLVMSIAENKISEFIQQDRTFEGLLMAVGAAFADAWLESKLKKN